MRIRWKLFWLLVVLSLGPLVLTRFYGQATMERLAHELAGQVGDQLTAVAENNQGKLVEDHARILTCRREALGLAVGVQARRVEGALDEPAPKSFPPGGLVIEHGRMGMHAPVVDGLAPQPGYVLALPSGETIPLPVDPQRVALRFPPGNATPALEADAARLATLVHPLTRLAREVGPQVHFQVIALENGLTAFYPAIGGYPMAMDPRQAPWYAAAREAHGAVWTSPQVDPVTNRVSVAVSRRLTRADGSFAGVLAIVVPLDELLSTLAMPGHLSGETRSLLVVAVPTSSGQPALCVEAGEPKPAHGHHWQTFVTPEPFTAPEADALAAMASQVTAGAPGVQVLTVDGKRSVVAHAPTSQGESLVQIAPLESVLATARASGESVRGSIHDQLLFNLAVVLAVAGLTLLAAMLASRAVTRPVLEIIRAARELAKGDFSIRAKVETRDEIGELAGVFNEVVPRLEEHMLLSEAVAIAREVQQNLLPAAPPEVPGLDIAAGSLYCDATGGDYFDFFPFTGDKAGRLGLAVGDVSGHGLGAALLMTTARALLRPRAERPGSPAEVVADVNRELTKDTFGTGRFMTLFYLEIDPAARALAWARAGHDPAMLYDPAEGTVTELAGRGMTMGVLEAADYEDGRLAGLAQGQTLLIGSDGIWESRDEGGAMFGKDRVRAILAAHATDGAKAVYEAVLAAVADFRGERPLEDDVTLVVVTVTA